MKRRLSLEINFLDAIFYSGVSFCFCMMGEVTIYRRKSRRERERDGEAEKK